MNTVFNMFGIVFSVIIVLAVLTFLAFTWVVIMSELIDLKEKMRVAKAVKESEAKK